MRVQFTYSTPFEAKVESESVARKQHEKWIFLTRVQFTYSTQFEAKVENEICWSKIIWEMNIFHESSVQLFNSVRSESWEWICWSKTTSEVNISHKSSVRLFNSVRRKRRCLWGGEIIDYKRMCWIASSKILFAIALYLLTSINNIRIIEHHVARKWRLPWWSSVFSFCST
jgi:hypothetical protein